MRNVWFWVLVSVWLGLVGFGCHLLAPLIGLVPAIGFGLVAGVTAGRFVTSGRL